MQRTNIGGNAVKGHGYIGGGIIDYNTAYINSSTPDNFTATDDGILFVHIGRPAYSYTVDIYVNNVHCASCYWDYAETGNITGDVQMPIKAGDVISIQTNLAAPNNFYIRRYVSKYR